MIILEFSTPRSQIFRQIYYFYFRRLLPVIGGIISKYNAYKYLPDSTEGFLSAEQMADRLLKAGFDQVGFRRFNLGTMAIHWGRRV